MSILHTVVPPEGPTPRGHYSPGVVAGGLLFVSGQIALRPDGSSLAEADLPTQTRQCLANLDAVLRAAGCTREQVLKTTVFLADADGWPIVNPIYAEFFGAHKPARSMVPVQTFHGGFRIEIEAVAACPTAQPR